MSMLEKPKTTPARADADGGGATAVLDPPVAGATDVVEAATTEAAIAEVHQRLGPDARILDARRVLRGGIGGFFAKEHVQLHAAPGSASTASAPGSSAPAPPAPGAPASSEPTAAPRLAAPRTGGFNPWAQVAADEAGPLSPVDRLLAQADDVPDEGPSAVDFATFLRTQLGQDGAPAVTPDTGPTVAPPVGSPAVSPAGSTAADHLDRPAWPRIEIDPAKLVGGRAVHLDADGEISEPLAAVPATPETAAPATAAPATAAPATAAPLAQPIGASAQAPIDASAHVRATPVAPTDTPAAAVTAPDVPMAATSPSELLVREPMPATDGGPTWSVPVLLALGLPVELVRSLEVDAPHDDIAWTMALAEALRPSCRPLPEGPAVFVGPRADGFASVDDAPVARSETWLAALRPGRWVHLVVGGDDWRRGLAESPLAASWAEPADLPDAIRCAVELGLVLGYGPGGAAMRRARPLDVALAVRELVVNR